MKTTKLFLLSIILIFIIFCVTQAQSSFSVSNKITGDTLFHIENDGKVGIDTTSPTASLHVAGEDGALFTGTFGSGTIPTEGAGSRMMWYPAKAAFRAGRVYDTGSNNWNDVNIGNNSIAFGPNTMASGDFSTAMGHQTTVSGNYSTAMGNQTTVSGYYSTAMGSLTEASGNSATAMGASTTASGNYSTAMGAATTASGDYSTAMGQEIEAAGSHTVAIALSDQNNLVVTQDSTMAIMGGKVGINESTPTADLQVGGEDGVLFTGTHGIGTIPVEDAGVRMMWYPNKAAFRAGRVYDIGSTNWNNTYIGNYSIASGYNTQASGSYSTAFGNSTSAIGHNSFAVGDHTMASGWWSSAMGGSTTASGDNSVAMGYQTTASGPYSTAMGYSTTASDNSSTALGMGTTASGSYSIAMGQEIEAAGSHTVAIALSDQNGLTVTQDSTLAIMGGNVGINESAPKAELQVGGIDGVLFSGTINSGTIPIEGEGTRMMWYPAKAAFRAGRLWGSGSTNWNSSNIGYNSFATGSNTTASGGYSTAMGNQTTASGLESTAMGAGTIANQSGSTAMGGITEASGYWSTAMGFSTTASGDNSTAMGGGTEASGDWSTAMGGYTTASGDWSTTMGRNTIASGDFSLAIGNDIEAAGSHNIAIALTDQNGLQVTQDSTLAIIGGNVGINEIAPTAELQVGGKDGVLFTGNYGSGTIPTEGAGTRLMWYPAKAAFRAGGTNFTHWNNTNTGNYSVGMGYNTTASGDYSTALGSYTTASANFSTAMGYNVTSSGTGSFTIGDNSTTSNLNNTQDNSFKARFNSYWLYSSSDLSTGVALVTNQNSWASLSDSTRKENFKPVDGEDFLSKISKFNLTSWNFKGQDPAQYRHYGPMAQDFYAAFGNDGIGVIGNDTTIASADFDGINFIAIQALEKRTKSNKDKLQESANENQKLKEQIIELQNDKITLNNKLQTMEQRLQKFEKMLAQLQVETNNNNQGITLSSQSR